MPRANFGLAHSSGKDLICPGLKLTDQFKTDFRNNSRSNPLKVKVFSVISRPTKTILIRDLDWYLHPLDTYKSVQIERTQDLNQIYEGKGSGLLHVDDPSKCLTRYIQLRDGEKYQVYSRYFYSKRHR